MKKGSEGSRGKVLVPGRGNGVRGDVLLSGPRQPIPRGASTAWHSNHFELKLL